MALWIVSIYELNLDTDLFNISKLLLSYLKSKTFPLNVLEY